MVVYGSGARRHVLLARRSGRVWALPGGPAEPGEDARSAAARVLRMECGLKVAALDPVKTWPGCGADRRADVCLYLLPWLAPLDPGGTALDAVWWPAPDGITAEKPGGPAAGTPTRLETLLAREGGLYEPDRPVLAAALAWLDAGGR